MPQTFGPPFRAEHIGSLKRPDDLLRKRVEFEEKKITREELHQIEDKYIEQIVQLQRDIGIKTITDGEFRRNVFFEGVFNNLDGMQLNTQVPRHMWMTYETHYPEQSADFKKATSYFCVGKLKRTRPFYVDQFLGVAQFLPIEEHRNIKITMCPPHWYHFRHGPYTYSKEGYKDDVAFFADLAQAYREEIADLYSVGCRNIQFDDPVLAFFCWKPMVEGMMKAGVDPEALFSQYIKNTNDCLSGKPADMHVGIHLCRGNAKDGQFFAEGGYDSIAIKLFSELHVDTYYLEYDTERSGTFEPLKFLPRNKKVVLGLVSSKVPQLEDLGDLEERVREAADFIANGEDKRPLDEALDQLCISPQCGFSSVSLGNVAVTAEDMKNKLKLVVDAAEHIWPSST